MMVQGNKFFFVFRIVQNQYAWMQTAVLSFDMFWG